MTVLKKILFPILLCVFITDTPALKLESHLLKIIDGNFMDADQIESIVYMINRILDIMNGKKQEDGSRIGMYSIGNTTMNLSEMIILEKNLTEKKLHGQPLTISESKLLEDIGQELIVSKKSFIEISEPLSKQARGMKEVFIHLIQESLEKRSKRESLLLLWASMNPDEEAVQFNGALNTCGLYGSFLGDLFNFLTDMAQSCPKAWTQFKDRTDKLIKIKKIIPNALNKLHVTLCEETFMSYLREKKHLEHIVSHDITLELVCELIKNHLRLKD